MKVIKTSKKTVVTLTIGLFYAKETIYQDSAGELISSRQLRALTPYRCTFGYDVLVYIGRALFVEGLNERQIVAALKRNNVPISVGEISYLGKKFIVYLALAHRQSRKRLKQAMALRGGYVLHLDGTCEADSPHLFSGIDGIARIVLDNIKLPSEKAAMLVPFLRRIQRQYGDPLALVHDMGRGLLLAIGEVFPGVRDFICHFHFLRDIGKDLFEKEYALIRNRLKKHKIRSVLRQRIKVLKKLIGEDERCLAAAMDHGRIDPAVLPNMTLLGSYALIHWCLDTSGLDGYGFPFDRPHLIFYQRLKVLHGLIDKQLIRSKQLARLWRPLMHIVEDQQLSQTARRMEKKIEVFERLRQALAIAPPGGQKGLNDDGRDVQIKSIAKKVKQFRQTIPETKEYRKIRVQIDKYWEKLFADPITVATPDGPVTIQPQRTNNLMERFFRDIKRCSRKRCGTISLNRTLRTILADTPLVKNLDNPEYLEIILDGCGTLEERFAKIDSRLVTEKLKAERRDQQRVSPEVKKLIRRPDLPDRLVALLAA
ncbi:MAG: transposase [Deltaproteobacteria bacterium]|nr:transposase [Deltaproteobacteria bacterium]